MKKLITRIAASLGYLLGALGVMLATPGLILILVADSILEWIEKKNISATDSRHLNVHACFELFFINTILKFIN